jgi:ParB-like chromosome segregation protein Spo0J
MSIVELPLSCLYTTNLRPSRESSDELVNSIKEKGIIEPIIVRPVNGGYEVVEGP